MRTLLLALAYDGACFHGWQVQRNAVSVQQTFQDAVERVLTELEEESEYGGMV